MSKKKSYNPIFACQHCGKRTELDFDPERDQQKWATLKCPFCNIPRIDENDITITTSLIKRD
jgi:hypothetical protein